MSITGTVPVKVPEKLSELELDAGGKRIDNLGLGDTPDDAMRRSEKATDYEVYGLLAAGLAADRPAPGIVDRFYFSTDTLVLERDTGVAWVEVVRGETAIRLAQLAERAHSSLTGIGPSDHHAKYTNAEAAAQAAALIALHAVIAAAHHTKTTTAAEITSGTFPVVRGGTGLSTIALGGILYASALDILSRLAPTASNQVLRSTAANALQFAALLAADIPDLAASKITSGQLPLARMPRAATGNFLEGNGVGADPIFNALVAGDIPSLDAAKIVSGVFVLARIPNMDWAHISGLFPRTIAAILSDHDLAHHPLAIIPTMDLAHIPSGIQGKLTAACAYKYTHPTTGTCPQAPQAHNQDASTITSGRFPMTRMPDGTSGLVLTAQGPGVDPAYATAPGVPSGLIAMWHGTIGTIPAGWVICDGNNSTPDLLAKFIEGVATAATNPGATGGDLNKTTSVKTGDRYEGENVSNATITHSHTVTDIRPPFYDVAFLMKT